MFNQLSASQMRLSSRRVRQSTYAIAAAVMSTAIATRAHATGGDTTVYVTGTALSSMNSYSPTGVPNSIDDVTFNSSSPTTATLTATNITYGSLDDTSPTATTIDNATTTATASTLTLGGTNFAGNNTVGAASGDLIYVAGGSTLNLIGPNASTGTGALKIALGQLGIFDIGSAGTLNISSVISGAFGINITGPGLVGLSGNNTFSGLVNISNGTLAIPVTGTTTTPLGTAGILFSGNSTLQLSSGTTTTLQPASFNIASGVTATLNTNGVATTFLSTAFTGTGNFNKSGLGILQIGVANGTYFGSFTIAGGIVQAGNAADFNNTSSGTITVENGGELLFSGGSTAATTFGQAVTIGTSSTDVGQVGAVTQGAVATFGSIKGTGLLNIVGAGTVQLSGNNSAFTGNINIASGVLSVDSGANTELGTTTASTEVITLNGGTFNYSSASTATTINPSGRTVAIGANGGTINANNAAGVLSIFDPVTAASGLMTSGALTINGAGTILLQNTADAGFPVILGASSASSTSTLMFTATSSSIGSLASGGLGGASLVLGYNKGGAGTILTIGTDGTSTSYAGTISDKPNGQTSTGSIVKVGGGTLSLSGKNTYTGTTNISGGTLAANTPGVGNSSTGIGAVNILMGGTLAGGTKGTPGQISGAVSVASGGFITAGTGKTTGDTTVGTLQTGAETWNSGGTYVLKIGSGNTSDELIMTGLTNATTAHSFAIQVTGVGGSNLNQPGSYVIAQDTGDGTDGGSTTSPFNLSSLMVTTAGNAPAASFFTLSETPDTVPGGGGGEDLVLTDTAPEPTSLLLLGAVASPLMLGRRGRRGVSRKI